MKNYIRTTISILGIVISGILCDALHAQITIVNDTIDLTPGIPKTIDVLANDIIPAGDSIKVIAASSIDGYIIRTAQSGGLLTYLANPNGYQWGAANQYTGQYTVIDYTSPASASAALVFRIRDFSYDSLYINNINALFNASGSHFWSYAQGIAKFEVPKFSGKTTIFLSTLWLGGLDQGDNLHLAAQRYGQGPNTGPAGTKYDFWAGPVMDSAAYSIYQDTLWNYIWNLKKSEIDYHKTHYTDAGYQPIYDILTWPGNGNLSLGQASNLAPFFDRNGDGTYNPMDGDYPLIRGDQALWFIFNDDRNVHAESEGEKMKMEIHGMAYAFDMQEDTAFNNTIFLNYKIYNRSDNIYHDTYIGVFTDTDIGYAADDYIGCDVERSYYFGYNGTPVDGTGQSNAYGINPPAQSVAILGGPLMDPDGVDNPRFDGTGQQLCNESVNGINFGDSIVDNERLGMSRFVYFSNSGVPAYMTDPLYAVDYYKFLRGIWKDDTQMIYGGNGHFSSGGYGPECKFMFPGESDSLNWGVGCVPPNGPVDWTETTAANAPGDRRGVGSCGPFTFQPGDVQELDLAFTFARDYTTKTPSGSLEKLRTVTDVVRKSFITNTLPDGNSFNGVDNSKGASFLQIQLFPNPASSAVYIRFDRTINEPVNIRIYNASGLLIMTEKKTPAERAITLDVTGLSSGLYLISFETKELLVTKKISVMK
jgi:hypothetical protein